MDDDEKPSDKPSGKPSGKPFKDVMGSLPPDAMEHPEGNFYVIYKDYPELEKALGGGETLGAGGDK